MRTQTLLGGEMEAQSKTGQLKPFGDGSKIIFVNRFFYPDHSATSQILSDLAFHLAGEGRSVHVVTSRQRRDDPDVRLAADETIHGVKVHRVAIPRLRHTRSLGRAIDYLSFYVGAAWCLVRLARQGDIVVVETDPPLLSVVLSPVVRLRRAKLVTWLQDLFPEIASALGVRVMQGRFGRWVRELRDASLRSATMNVVLGEREKAVLLRRGVPEDRIRLIHNWSDDGAIQPISTLRNPLRKTWQLEGKFVVEYSGNLGRAHDVETILDAAALLSRSSEGCAGVLESDGRSEVPDRFAATPAVDPAAPRLNAGRANQEDGERAPEVVFLFIGGGPRYQWLVDQVAQRGLKNMLFQPYQSRERLVESLGVGDVHLVSLLPEMEGLTVPSKFYGIASAGRPMVFIGDGAGEISQLLRRGQCGVTVAPGDAESLADWILRLRDRPDIRQLWGRNARQLLDERFTQARAFESWDAVLEVQGQAKEAGLDE